MQENFWKNKMYVRKHNPFILLGIFYLPKVNKIFLKYVLSVILKLDSFLLNIIFISYKSNNFRYLKECFKFQNVKSKSLYSMRSWIWNRTLLGRLIFYDIKCFSLNTYLVSSHYLFIQRNVIKLCKINSVTELRIK